MGLFSKFTKNNRELDACLNRVANNATNNYKDVVQEAFRDFLKRYEELLASGQLNEKQKTYYEGMKTLYEKELKGFKH